MSKKDLYFSDAERFYIVDNMNPESIAGRLGLAEKTVRLWREEGGWEEKRAAFMKSKQSMSEGLYELADLLIKSIKADLLAGRKTDQGRLYTFSAIISRILKVKEYEDVAKKIPSLGQSKDVGGDIAKLIEDQLMGGAPALPPADEHK